MIASPFLFFYGLMPLKNNLGNTQLFSKEISKRH